MRPVFSSTVWVMEYAYVLRVRMRWLSTSLLVPAPTNTRLMLVPPELAT